ncbi:MAG: RNA methyltransferase [Gemmatimonadota bacterium]|nr:RNA methyltransferase [Gemmatimonadota bacterium]
MDPRRNVLVVLHEPQNLVNIAGVVRGMANMGLEQLTLVSPAEFDGHRITGIAHRTDHIVDGISIVDSLDEALADTVYVMGTSARARTAQRNYGRPRALAERILNHALEGPAAIVFGREDRGLSNEALDRCQDVAVVPTTEEYSSLNLAQAFLVIAYEILVASGMDQPPFPTGKRSVGPATGADLEEMYGALESGLECIDFFKSRKAESVMRTLRTALSRSSLDGHEARLLRSVGYEMRNVTKRLQDDLARAREGPPDRQETGRS